MKAHKRTGVDARPIVLKSRRLDKIRLKLLYKKHIEADRAFAGFVSFDSKTAYKTDVAHMQDVQGLYDSGQALAFWTEQKGWITRDFKINDRTGGARDAGMYAIAAALSIAVARVKV